VARQWVPMESHEPAAPAAGLHPERLRFLKERVA